eukprot:9701-Eustigmatos_ZCMA.PRE.1
MGRVRIVLWHPFYTRSIEIQVSGICSSCLWPPHVSPAACTTSRGCCIDVSVVAPSLRSQVAGVLLAHAG